ncbi:uncharacterized protein LOC123656185 [Melitaea cinxia]|uniref:uncharacterized protein LOC123656185 n=1 Tax=Melitaea cinxia TaxID=113334 RepID=UPI001E26ED84|nr:uncharacterized protein LOC123656185 [Melitaea cinxia]
MYTKITLATSCTSNHISRDASPISTPKSTRTPRRKETTPKTIQNTKKINYTPRNITKSPKIKSPNTQKTSKVNSPKVIVDLESSTNVGRIDNKKETEDKISGRERDRTINVGVENNNENVKVDDVFEKERNKAPESGPASVEVTKLLRQLCGGDAGNRSERTSGAKNAQLFCVTGSSPRQPSTPQLLRILEETIQKKTQKALFPKTIKSVKDAEKYRMSFNIPDHVSENFFQYRTKFVQHMLSSTMYANSAIGKPWEKIGSVSDRIIDELLMNCVKEMELQRYVQDLYKCETC